MILLPYFLDSNQKQLGIFLCEGGNALWEVDDTESMESIQALLEENGLPVQWIHRSGVIHIEINYQSLKLKDFYLSTDPGVSDKDVWQLFDVPSDMWLEPEFHDVLDVLTGYKSASI